MPAITRFRYNEVFFHTVNPLLSPPPPPPGGGLFISKPFEGEELNRDGALNIFNLETTMLSVLHKELEYKVEKLTYKKFQVIQPRIRIKFKFPVGK